MYLGAALFLGHLIADFPLQTTAIYDLKVKSWKGVLLHTLIHMIVTALLIYPLHNAVPLLVVLGFLHFVTDYFKVHISSARRWPGFLIDQLVHIAVLVLLTYTWQASLHSVLPLVLLLPLLVYSTFLATLVFLWVLSCDLAEGQWGEKPWVQWARHNLLTLSQYAGLPLFISLFHFFYHRSTVRT